MKNQEDQSYYNDRGEEREEEEETLANAGCFRNLSCFNLWRTNDIDDGNLLLNYSEAKQKETWLVQKLKNVKEASEVLAGPKWKNFIRKLSAYFRQSKKCRNTRFQYDSYNYALNFDDPAKGDGDGLFVSFSARFAPPLKHDQR